MSKYKYILYNVYYTCYQALLGLPYKAGLTLLFRGGGGAPAPYTSSIHNPVQKNKADPLTDLPNQQKNKTVPLSVIVGKELYRREIIARYGIDINKDL